MTIKKEYRILMDGFSAWPEIFDDSSLETLYGDIEYLKEKHPDAEITVEERTTLEWTKSTIGSE